MEIIARNSKHPIATGPNLWLRPSGEALTLTRDIPTGLGWLIEPFITNIPKESLEFTLQALRKAALFRKPL